MGELQAALERGELIAPAALEAGKPGASGVAQTAAAAAGRTREARDTQNRARELTDSDPARAAHLIRAWIAGDGENKEGPRV